MLTPKATGTKALLELLSPEIAGSTYDSEMERYESLKECLETPLQWRGFLGLQCSSTVFGEGLNRGLPARGRCVEPLISQCVVPTKA